MSSMALVEGPDSVAGAWDTDGQVFFSLIKPGTTEFSKPQSPPGSGNERKHPALAFNARGERLLAWTEGTGWERGGALAWQLFDKSGKPTDQKGRADRGIPVWGLPAVVATEAGFTIIH